VPKLLDVAKEVGEPGVYIHCFDDGRDLNPKSGASHIQTIPH
jgi:2,3-bisphosphoglycerate-independent phosphoglycerate mutase